MVQWIITINKLKLNKMKILNKLAEEVFGEFGFSTLTEKQQEYIINKYYKIK